ncbi:unnamed protein product [Amaranthus hypochondriacus]
MLNFRYQLLRPNLPVIEAFNIAGFITVQCTPIHAAITPLLCTCIYDDVGVAVITVTGSGKLCYIMLSNQSGLMGGFYRRTSLPCLCVFPASSSWIVEGHNITWKAGSCIFKSRCKSGCKASSNVEAFYVSGMLIPHGVSSLNFIVQVSGIDLVYNWLILHPSYWILKQDGIKE